ncbi:MAG: hypothetical protein ABS59_03780 [Methylobacterium sp. SCN 67-24]|nr:MAG: hypothetical protein ABS59_03780 [Methylobacterium sp. SCN 67-24]
MNLPLDRNALVPPNSARDGERARFDPIPALFSRMRSALGTTELTGEGVPVFAPLLAAIAQTIDADAVAAFVVRDGSASLHECTLDHRHRDIGASLAAEMRVAAFEAIRGSGTNAEPSTALPSAFVLAAASATGSAGVTAIKSGTASEVAKARAVLELAAAAVDHLIPGEGASKLFCNLANKLSSSPAGDIAELAQSIATAFSARQVIVGRPDGVVCAMAPAGPLRNDSPGGKAIHDALARAGSATAPIVERGEADGSIADLFQADVVIALPIGTRRRGGNLVCLLVEPGAEFKRLDGEEWKVVQALLNAHVEAPTRLRGSGRRLRPMLLATLAAAAIIAAMFIPVADRIRAESELEPDGRRFVTATFNAVVAQAQASPGDTVSKGDRIAELEGEELVLSRAEALARADEAFRRRDAAVLAKRATEAELARLEGEAAAAERDLLDWQIAQLTLKSPVDGIVLASPFEHSEGAPVREGDVVAEIAPLDRLRLRIDVPIEDFNRLPLITTGELYLDGASRDAVHLAGFTRAARAETIGGHTVVPLRTEIENRGLDLRPGQKGIVLLPTGTTWLGEVLFRNAWNGLRRWTR